MTLNGVLEDHKVNPKQMEKSSKNYLTIENNEDKSIANIGNDYY
jgi:hypothetical protein